MFTNKNILIFGVGGHGWESLSSLLIQETKEFKVYGTTVDWGGSTGFWGRLLELNDDELNKNLHSQITQPVLPWGDFNKLIIYFLEKSFGLEVAESLNFRSLEILEHLQQFKTLEKALDLEEKMADSFKEYLQASFNFLEKNSTNLEEIKTICLGNPWHQFLCFKLGNLKAINEFYHQKKVLPSNIYRLFTSNEREVLIGKNTSKKVLIGEDPIDISETAIEPKTLKHFNKKQKKARVSRDFLLDIQKSDYLVIPNGSIANWLPLINYPQIRKELVKKSAEGKIIWILNLFHTLNELNITSYVEYLYSLNIFPKILVSKDLPENIPQEIYQKYREQGKFLNLHTPIEVSKLRELNHNLHFELECDLNLTYKYDPDKVSQSILNLINES